MKHLDINSGDDYAQILMDTIIEGEKSIPEKEQMPIDLLTYLSKLIHDRANEYWAEYIIGKRDTFVFEVGEMEDMFNKAGEMYTSDVLDGMHEKGLLDMSISEDGEFLYSLSEDGKHIAETLFKNKKS